MRQLILAITAFIAFAVSLSAQIDSGSLMGLPSATTAEMNAITGPAVGGCLYNTDEDTIYYYTSTGWQRATDDQDASEVNLVSAVDSDGDSANETTVEDVVQAITPITSASGRIFYPPSIAIDASTNGTSSVDLYQEYINQFAPTASPYTDTFVASAGAPGIPIYGRTELYYYVTYADPDVFGNGTAVQNMSIDANGVLSYEIFDQPADYNSLINVVFVVR
ncbi:hypothetical protein [Allomuricauda sp. d1]|uniref:hypothetical protein n=1 Tax=Allomuricauda sp. d1 TaxID=3136725 RepID=UPI0031DDB5BA